MTIDHRGRYGPHAPDVTYVEHAFAEQLVDLGEIEMNYATAGDPSKPALLCIPGQTESWWGYEAAMPRLAEHFEVFAVDLRGQGRSTRTPGRYTLDNMGNDLVRFIDVVIGRPTIVSGLSSGRRALGVAVGVRQARSGRSPPATRTRRCSPRRCSPRPAPASASRSVRCSTCGARTSATSGRSAHGTRCAPPRPSGCPHGWRRSRSATSRARTSRSTTPSGAARSGPAPSAASCDHERMLRSVKVPHVLLTHHFRMVDETTGVLMGALTDVQADRVQELLREAGVSVTYR